jgi:adenylate cyclase
MIFANFVSRVRGGGLPALPLRVREDIARSQDRLEQVISSVQIAIVVLFGGLFLISPRPDVSDIAFALTPWALGGYLVFSILRLVLSCRMRLPGWFLTLSVIADMALLMVLIWSFHRTYLQPPSFYLKAPTLLYVFIFIALRALRFDARYVILAGVTAVIGWGILVLYAAAFETGDMTLTRDYVAEHIISSDHELNPGEGQLREAAVVFFDILGFTGMSGALDNQGPVRLLSDYQSRIVPIVQANNGVIDKFLGDGVMATFGAVVPSQTYACDALRAVEAVITAIESWNAERTAQGESAISVNASAASGSLIFAAVGDERRLEYTVIGDTVNLAAKLEKHAKQERTRGVVSTDILDLAQAQGFVPTLEYERRPDRRVEGVGPTVSLSVIGPDRA